VLPDAPAPAPPLAGLRVLDLSRVLAGPYCTMLLADLGAEVVKIERPDGGDTTRGWGPPFAGGESTYFLSVNRGKRSAAVDLATPSGQELLRGLAARSDLVVENFLPAVAARLGVTHAALAAGNPALVLVSIRGYPRESATPTVRGSMPRSRGRPG
jgi:formyl-CoA transferase/CoA:oxalate CoA-transferase